MQKRTVVMGKATKYAALSSYRGPLIEVRQFDLISGENIVMLDKELILKLAEIIKEEK